MSILIKGIEMPKEPWECPCRNGENGRCKVTQKICVEIPKDCPLVSVPSSQQVVFENKTEEDKENSMIAEDEKTNLLEIHKELAKINTAQKELQENYENELRALRAQKTELETKLKYETDGINSTRIDNAKRFIYIEGLKKFGVGETGSCVNELISDIVNDNYKILKEYYGCKNYEGFICQRSDHRYGYGPKHGDIVFSIRATQDFREGKITPNEKDKNDILYMLENIKNYRMKE